MSRARHLLVVADDFGIGPATSRAILELAVEGLVTGTVLLVNSPHAEDAVRAWRKAGRPVELGWHPCLTLDRPVLPAARVPSLVGPDGNFWPLGAFLRRSLAGRLRADEVRAELRAQYRRFFSLVGRPPAVVNSHQHVQLFPPVGAELLDLLGRCKRLPYLRRIREPWSVLARVPGARLKRAVLGWLGRRQARRQDRLGFPGNDWLAGITDPPCVEDPDFHVRWLSRLPGQVVELTCHPGHWDLSLVGRDGTEEDGLLRRRVRERELLRHPSFRLACVRAGFRLTVPGQLGRLSPRTWQARAA
jgi:predicted glycoside hydrolase/deacetylase ChbG (UPF0249 family)